MNGTAIDRAIMRRQNKQFLAAVKELIMAGRGLAAELCSWCPKEVRGDVLARWDKAEEAIREQQDH